MEKKDWLDMAMEEALQDVDGKKQAQGEQKHGFIESMRLAAPSVTRLNALFTEVSNRTDKDFPFVVEEEKFDWRDAAGFPDPSGVLKWARDYDSNSRSVDGHGQMVFGKRWTVKNTVAYSLPDPMKLILSFDKDGAIVLGFAMRMSLSEKHKQASSTWVVLDESGWKLLGSLTALVVKALYEAELLQK